MKVDFLKYALKGDVLADVTQAIEGDRMVTLKGKNLLVEQEGGEIFRYLLCRYLVDPGDLYLDEFVKK